MLAHDELSTGEASQTLVAPEQFILSIPISPIDIQF